MHAAEYEMNIRLERLRVLEALSARDVAVGRLAEACSSVREKAEKIQDLSNEKENLVKQLEVMASDHRQPGNDGPSSKNVAAPTEVRKLVECMQTLENKLASLNMTENRPPNAREDVQNEYKPLGHKLLKQNIETTVNNVMKTLRHGSHGTDVLRDATNGSPASVYATPNPLRDCDNLESPWTPVEGERVPTLPTATTTEKIQSRYAVLASLALPRGIPNDALTPIIIPSPYSVHDFISTTGGHLRSQIGNYRIFQQSTTTWCPEREEHGYYLTPAFKCSTNPRVTTAHRWSAVDLAAKLDKPTECFFNKDGNWYYAGIYQSFRLEDLCSQEWECLSPEASHATLRALNPDVIALIRETLAGRKNTSPQNIYETGQLYSAGALKAACIGLQCIGFNDVLYRGLLEHAAHCTQTGKWRVVGYGGTGGTGAGGTGLGIGTAWNVNPNANAGAHSPGGIAAVPSGLSGGDGVLSGSLLSAL
ncbi:uncharacterized protein TRAVEDRAFT_19515 [Trametes versicolor FP-101664 SS1]|uniref:uncharacterized protein n=1 Tax=Trametes versicolor (strain FP-101664) TaxID=717944 RepID=UPI0004623EC4|nr:uncharacterized protein TRAVEDRAFT_19515 [Trametes versicolor FP-101664 SS1]EIW61013.1 hypothetical protein TRAVEDRAFT_19515 [Trametes versicolor FP-101664 SS1]